MLPHSGYGMILPVNFMFLRLKNKEKKNSCRFYYWTLQVIAFSDEEGVRFQSTFLGSAAVAGILPASALHISDKRFPCLEQLQT